MSQVQILVSDEGNRRALAGMLEARHGVEVDETLRDVDCYIVDDLTIPEYRDTLLAHKREHHPVFCPVVLIRREDTDIDIGLPDADAVDDPQVVDEIMTAPVEKSILFRRLSNLLVRRAQTEKLIEKTERLEQFAYAASHDLQEPLRMVSSYLQMIDRRYSDELDEDGEEFIEFAVDGADRMRDMIEGLLKYSRVDTRGNPFEPVDLETVVADVRADLQVAIAESDAAITVDSLPRVDGDEGQLRQVFQNLLDNAIEYSGDESPQVHVSAKRDGAGSASERSGTAAETDGTEWVIAVSDDGVGIDPDDTERVFEVFQSLHAKEHSGMGIGLALCERIVERHGGDIWVESDPGEGATFAFTLPADGEHSE